MSGWTDERVATLKKMHGDGEVVPKIVEATGMTKGAVSGKLFRLGLCTPHNEQWGKGRAQRIKSRAARMDRSNAGRLKREAAAADIREQFAAVEIVDLPPDQSAVAVSHKQLSDKICHWPLGDPRDLDALKFCGEQTADSYFEVYCPRHCAMAYIPLVSRPKYMQAAE
jgi:hypothetical protein